MEKTTTLAQLAPNKRNPRKITPKRLQMLKKAMAEFGDLGGIVRAADGTLVGGHQRIEAYRNDKNAKVEITKAYDKPTKAGTTAEGYVLIGGERFSYRETNWDGARAQAAAIGANQNAGDWDITALTASINELADANFDLDLTMFDEDVLAAYLPDANDLAQAPQGPSHTEESTGDQQAQVPPVGTVSAQPQGVPPAHVKMVQLFFRTDEHAKFVELTDALKAAYKRENLSETVMEAIQRASISAAL